MTVDRIDLERHAVIEASAGTGKTYTIENLVLRLLTEAGAPLESILLVTFTEKATGELRTRLRATLERTARDRPEHAAALVPALNHFDQAPIFTIHGFCQRLLQEFALEQGQDFRPALVDDAELLPGALREVQRRLWRSQFGDRLRDVLERGCFGLATATKWEDQVRAVAEYYHPGSDHQLRPVLVPDWWQRLDDPLVQPAGQLEVFTVEAVRRHLADHKRQRGLQSFDDMITTVEASLDPQQNHDAASLVARLRGRFRFGIVDEFQDTDPIQWRIFRRIFLEGGASRLFVVGDPKQAIFAFRGADLPTYLKATREMREEFGAGDYPLTVNWRSTPELLEALNCVFMDGDWFPKETGITYRAVVPPEEAAAQVQVTADLTNRAALTLVDLRAWERRPKVAGQHYGRFVAREIGRLLAGSGGQPSLAFTSRKGEPRPLRASDICVLVLRRSEATALVEELDALDIPYSFHRQTGFWQSAEVRELQAVLQCLARPEERVSLRRALLTCFFRVRPADVVRCPDLPPAHAARRLWQRWLEYADARQWSALFQSMVEETGLLLRASDGRDQDRVDRLRQAMGTLERVGHGENRDLLGLLDWLAARRQQRDTPENAPAPAETDRPRVRIMTVHASKGLEFPVVFLAGGFTAGPAARGAATYRDDQGRKVFDFCPDAEARGRMAAEGLAELRRLLYVALTRPMFKLYVPMLHIVGSPRPYVGPAGTILLPALKQSCPDKLGPLFAEIIAPPRLAGLDDGAAEDDAAPLETRPALAYTGPLFPALDPHLEWRRVVVRSFSSMSRQHVAAVGAGHSYGDRPRLARDEAAPAAERDDPLRGAAFGDIVHTVLETIDFAEVGHCAGPAELLLDGTPARQCIDRAVRANVADLRGKAREEIEPAARQQAAHLVWQALHTPLAAAGGPLWQLAPADRIHELEFHCPEQPGEMLPAEVRREDGFLTGFMDLVFRRGGRYFLVDFKTNLLAGYTAEHLARCMDEADYHRQYRLYLHALDRWLARVHGSPASHLLGGVYYLFVRGLNGRDETGGVFFHRPTADDLDLARIMAR